MAAKYPSIPDPTTDPASLRDSVLAIKQAVEILTGQRGDAATSAAITASNLPATAPFSAIPGKPTTLEGYGITDGVVLLAGHQTIAGGFSITPANLGNSAATTLDPSLGNYQYITNNGAFTLTAPTSDCAIDLWVFNASGAGAITFSGFTVGSFTGDALTTTSTSKFIISIRRVNGTSTYITKALQ